MNQVKVLFFATLRERVGIKSLELELPAEATVSQLKTALAEQLPVLKGLWQTSLVAVNHEYVFDDSLVPVNAEIAIFPPVSGG